MVLVSIGVKSSNISAPLLFSTTSATNPGLNNRPISRAVGRGLGGLGDAGAEPVFALHLGNQVSESRPLWCQLRLRHETLRVHELGQQQLLVSKFGRLEAQRYSSELHALRHIHYGTCLSQGPPRREVNCCFVSLSTIILSSQEHCLIALPQWNH